MKTIIDTNILLDNTFEQVIQSLKQEEQLTLIIPFKVISELDTFKTGMETINIRARDALRFIEAVRKQGQTTGRKLTEGVSVQEGIDLIVKIDQDLFSSNGEKDSSDIKILKQGLYGEEDKDISFISSDLGARIISDCMNVNSCNLMPAIDTKDYEEKRIISINDDQLSLLYRSPKAALEIEGDFVYNEFIEMRDSTGCSHYGVYDGQNKSIKKIKPTYNAWGVKPRINGDQLPIPEQALLMQFLLDPEIELLNVIGSSGCGKTFLTLACALEQTLGKKPIYDKIIIMRPLAIIDKDIGALPGDKVQKLTPWLGSIVDNLSILLNRKSPDEISGGCRKDDHFMMNINEQINALIESGKLELEALTYIRGRSIPKAFILVEDAQNLLQKEAATIVTRVGEGSKLVFLGDISPAQIDNPRLNQYNNGLTHIAACLSGVDPSIATMTMNKVVRSKLASLGVEYL